MSQSSWHSLFESFGAVCVARGDQAHAHALTEFPCTVGEGYVDFESSFARRNLFRDENTKTWVVTSAERFDKNFYGCFLSNLGCSVRQAPAFNDQLKGTPVFENLPEGVLP